MTITAEFRQRVPRITMHPPQAGKPFYRLTHAEYVPDAGNRFGPNHHILIDVWGKDGHRKLGVPVRIYWPGNDTVVMTNKTSGPFAADFPMYASGYAYGVTVGQWSGESDDVFGMGLGELSNIHQGDHVSYFLIFQEMTGTDTGGDVGEQPTQPPLDDETRAQIAQHARAILALVE